MQAIFKTYNRCLFKSATGASFTLFSNIYSRGDGICMSFTSFALQVSYVLD